MDRLRGAIAAAVTPLRDGGRRLDEEAFPRLVRFLADGGVDGVLAAGTTGEGVLLSVGERLRVTELFMASRPAGFQVAVHAGAQTTADSVAIAAHAQEAGADAVAVIAPPYFPLDEEELVRHFVTVASACEPVAFYVYEFVGRSGYAIPVDVIHRIRERAPNLRGMKVSDSPFEAVEPYLGLDGLDVFIGLEPLVLRGMERGAVGAVSGLATAYPRIVAELVHDRSASADKQVNTLRDGLQGIPFHAAMKEVLVARDVLVSADVRAPLRGPTDDERARITALDGAIAG
jgi:dihydrodipicolinate synthase/N-acetylneuraminate lyase